MNGFHSGWRGMSSHESPRTIGKKIANSIVGKSIGTGAVGGPEQVGSPLENDGRC